MAQPGECIFCLTPVTNVTTLTCCCQQPCHATCATSWKKHHSTLACLYCRQVTPISTLQVIHPQQWKEDPHFVEQVKRVWKDNPMWYGILYEGQGPLKGFWGELKDP